VKSDLLYVESDLLYVTRDLLLRELRAREEAGGYARSVFEEPEGPWLVKCHSFCSFFFFFFFWCAQVLRVCGGVSNTWVGRRMSLGEGAGA
jgi:hypothetical protein